jgi:hypothetical protein
MAKIKIEVLNAVIDGKQKGEQFEVDDKSAKHLIAINYAKKVEANAEDKPAVKKPAKKSNR